MEKKVPVSAYSILQREREILAPIYAKRAIQRRKAKELERRLRDEAELTEDGVVWPEELLSEIHALISEDSEPLGAEF